jgi:hypothetical protein
MRRWFAIFGMAAVMLSGSSCSTKAQSSDSAGTSTSITTAATHALRVHAVAGTRIGGACMYSEIDASKTIVVKDSSGTIVGTPVCQGELRHLR